MSTVAQMVSKCLRVKRVQRKCEDRRQHGVARPHAGRVESKPISFYEKWPQQSEVLSAAGYHSFSHRPDIDFNYFLLFHPFLCR